MKAIILKGFIFCYLFLSFIIPVFSQDESENIEQEEVSMFLPRKGDVGFSLIIDGLIDDIRLESNKNEIGQNILFAKFYLKDNLALRTGFGVNVDRTNSQSKDSVGINLEEVDSLRSKYFFNFSIGIEKHLKANKRLDPFIFTQVDLTFIGKENIDAEVRTITAVGTSTAKREITEDGGIAFGLRGGGGFNYFLANRFSIGTEFSFNISLISEGGTISDNRTNTSINGDVTSDINRSESKVNTLAIDVQPSALINISYFF